MSGERRQPAYASVADHLRRRIVSGELAAGQRLPSEALLQEAFGVSRSTVREALRMLASQRLVSTTRGVTGGTTVEAPDPGDVAEMLSTSLALLSQTESCTVVELLEVRELLEVPAARLAAQRRTDVQLARLSAAVPGTDGDQPPTTYEVNRSLHELVLEASGNRLLPMLTQPLFEVMRTRFLRDRAPAGFWDAVHDDHGSVVEAIAARDAEGAAAAMATHLARLRETYEAIDAGPPPISPPPAGP